nr:hypothetical protein [Deltaproteobacteria bacterium]
MNFTNPHSMKVKTVLESFLLKLLFSLLALIPYPVLSPLFRGLARLSFLLGIRRRIVMTNLTAALGEEVPESRLRSIALSSYVDFGQAMAEIAKPGYMIGNREKIFRVEGIEHLNGELEKGKGVVILTGHIGNYLVAGYLFRNFGYRVNVVSKNLKSEAANREFVRFFERYGSALIKISGHKDDPVGGLRILRALKKGEIVVIMNDQDAGPRGYKSTFFGLPTYIPSGPAQFIYKSEASVITFFAYRKEGKIVLAIQGPIDYSEAKNVDEAEKIIFDEYSKRLEEKVKEFPGQYFWLHKKWKS